MRELRNKINDMDILSKKMKLSAMDAGYDKSQEIRKEQDKVYKKLMFLKGMNKALEKQEKEERENKNVCNKT